MDKFINLLTKDKWLLLIWSLCTSLIGMQMLLDEKSFPYKQVYSLSPSIPAHIIYILLAISLALILSLVRLNLKNKPNLNNFEHIEDPGWYIHNKTNKKFCGKCIHPPKNLESPLSVYKGTNDWHCIICGEKYIPKDGGDSFFLDEEQKLADKLNADLEY